MAKMFPQGNYDTSKTTGKKNNGGGGGGGGGEVAIQTDHSLGEDLKNPLDEYQELTKIEEMKVDPHHILYAKSNLHRIRASDIMNLNDRTLYTAAKATIPIHGAYTQQIVFNPELKVDTQERKE